MESDLISVNKSTTIKTNRGPFTYNYEDILARIGVSDTSYVSREGVIVLNNESNLKPIDFFYKGDSQKNSNFCKGNSQLIESKIQKIAELYRQAEEKYKNITKTQN